MNARQTKNTKIKGEKRENDGARTHDPRNHKPML